MDNQNLSCFSIFMGFNLALLSMHTQAEIVNVPDNCETLQRAIEDSRTEDGDTVHVMTGFDIKSRHLNTKLTSPNLPSGIYFVRLKASAHVVTQKIMLIK